MQLKRSKELLGAGFACLSSQWLIVSIFPWSASVVQDVMNVVCTALNLLFSLAFIWILGGNLFSPTLNQNGWPQPDQRIKLRAFIVMFAAPIILTVLTHINVPALKVIDLFLLLGVLIRLIQWNGIEPNGLGEYGMD